MATEGLVLRLAELARLHLTEEESERLEREISGILEHVRRLEEVDLSGVPAAFWTAFGTSELRPDEPRPSLDLDEALGGAPERAGRLLIVPPLREDA